MKRTGLVSLVALAVVVVGAGVGAGAGCSGGAKAKPQPTLAEEAGGQEGGAETGGGGQDIAAPPVDPMVVPDGTVATVSIGDPMTVLTDLSAYLTTAGFAGAPAAVATTAGMVGLSLEKPIAMVVVYGDMGPEPVIAGTPTDEQAVKQFAQASGMSAEIENGIVVLGRLEQQDRVGPHLRWRLGQPVPPELRFEVASQMVNQVIAMASASMPNNPLAGFDSIEKLSGSMNFDANDATLKLVVDGRAGTGLATFAASLAPSDFRLAGIVARQGDPMFGAGTLDYKLIGDGMRSWLGPMMDMWRAVVEATDGATAFSYPAQGSIVAVLGVKPGATDAAVAAYEQSVRAMATPVVVMNTSTVGKLRVKKVGKYWLHQTEATLTDAATDQDREAMRRMYGAETIQSLVGVVDGLGITAMGKGRDKAVVELVKRAKGAAGGAPVPVKAPGVLAAIEEARLANEAFVATLDIGTFVAWFMPADMGGGGAPVTPAGKAGGKAGKAAKKAPVPPSRPQVRMGLGRVGEAIGFRLVLPAQQLSALRDIGAQMQATP